MLSSSTTSTDLPSSNNSSLDILKHMIHEVEHEMEEYERWTGREVKGLQGGQGLTGFTLSLVSSLCRLVRYLKEVRVQGYVDLPRRHEYMWIVFSLLDSLQPPNKYSEFESLYFTQF